MSCNNIIVIGTGRSVLKEKNGNKIDSFNCVYRSARALLYKGYEEYIGNKTDVVWVKDIYLGDILGIKKINGELFILSDDHNKYSENRTILNFYNSFDYIQNPYFRNLCLDKIYNYHNIKTTTYLPSYYFLQLCMHLNFHNVYTRDKLTPIPTAGITVLFYLVEVRKIKNICVTGFDFFKTNNYFLPINFANKLTQHKTFIEQMYYNKLLKEGKIYELR